MDIQIDNGIAAIPRLARGGLTCMVMCRCGWVVCPVLWILDARKQRVGCYFSFSVVSLGKTDW